MNLTTANYGVGLSLAYDSRDVLTNPHKGYYLNITQCFRPKFLGNDYAFSTTDLRTSYYHPVWKRNGVVVWIGAGTVFNKFSALRMDRVLPNYGIGYRWEFKKNVNVRLDYGFGKNGQSGFIFNINEAF